MPRMVFSEPGRARTREPLAKRTESLVSLSSLTFLSTMARNSENLSISSWRLPERGRVQDYGAAGLVDGLPEGQDGRDGGLAGLPGAVEDDPLGPGAEELGLPGIRLELEVIEREKDGISLGPVKDLLLGPLGSFQLYRV